MPLRLTSPRVGLMPTIPQALAGQRMLPSVSVPTAIGARPAATATPEPELDPDGLRPGPCGLTACPPSVLHPLLAWQERLSALGVPHSPITEAVRGGLVISFRDPDGIALELFCRPQPPPESG